MHVGRRVIEWRRSVVVSALASINVVNRHWARLVLGWVTACGRVLKPSRYVTSHLGNSAFHPSGVDKSSTGLYGWG